MTSWWLRPPADDGEEQEKEGIVPPEDKPFRDASEEVVAVEEESDGARRSRRRGRKRVSPRDAEEAEVPEPESAPPPRPPRKARAKGEKKAKEGGEKVKEKEKEKEKEKVKETGSDRLRWREGEEPPPTFHQILQSSEVPVAAAAPVAVHERRLALFCDLENIALGVRDSQIQAFNIDLVLERLLEKGRIIVKKAYCDWERYSEYKRPFHEAAIEMIGIPHRRYSGKNSADIKMVVDAMDLSYSNEHLDTFVILSGDSDFSPLVSKLRENNKFVIGVGVKNSSSPLLIDNCDEFIYYEDLWRDTQRTPKLDGLEKKQTQLFALMTDSILALLRENKDVLWGSMIKQTMQRKRPSFSESYFGYSSFSELLEDAQSKGLIRLRRDPRSGTYVVTGFAGRG